MSQDEFMREVTVLVDALLGDIPIEYDCTWSEYDRCVAGHERWHCTLCGGVVLAALLPQEHHLVTSFQLHATCDYDVFPHRDTCPVMLARRLQYYVR